MYHIGFNNTFAIGWWIHYSGLTAIHATSEEVAKWVDKENYARVEGFRQAQLRMEQEERQRLLSSQAVTPNNGASISSASTSSPPQKYSFICECFFLTARVLNLGLLKALSDFKLVMQVYSFEIAQPWLVYLDITHNSVQFVIYS